MSALKIPENKFQNAHENFLRIFSKTASECLCPFLNEPEFVYPFFPLSQLVCPKCANLFFSLASSECFFPLNVPGLPFRTKLSFLFVSSDRFIPVRALDIFLLCSSENFIPFLALDIFAAS